MLPGALLDPADARVQEAKRSFERRKSKCRLSFEDLMSRFASDETFESIGKAAGLKKESTWALFNKDFRQLFPHRTSERIRRAHHQRKRAVARKIALSEHPFGFVREAARRARLHGCAVEAIPIQPAAGVAWRGAYKHLLYINDRLARVYEVENMRSASASGDKAYAKVRLIRHMLEEVEFAIFNVAPPGHRQRTFVVPTALFLERYFSNPKGPVRKYLYIPLDRWPVYHRRPRIDMWEYLEAYRLFKAK